MREISRGRKDRTVRALSGNDGIAQVGCPSRAVNRDFARRASPSVFGTQTPDVFCIWAKPTSGCTPPEHCTHTLCIPIRITSDCPCHSINTSETAPLWCIRTFCVSAIGASGRVYTKAKGRRKLSEARAQNLPASTGSLTVAVSGPTSALNKSVGGSND